MTKKTVIGITGGIGSGKSMVLRMMQELGATVIDADKIAHDLMKKGTPVYQTVVDEFGKFVIGEGGEIDRSRLGKLVFSVPEALAKLDALTHPSVRQAINQQIAAAPTAVVAIEAIKLFEAGIAEDCTARWFIVAKPEVQLKRLVEKRHMSAEAAKQRIRAQISPEQFTGRADVIVDNSADLGKTWAIVKKHFTTLMQAQKTPEPPPPPPVPEVAAKTASGEIVMRRAKRADLEKMIEMVGICTKKAIVPNINDMMESLFSRAFLVVERGNQVVGIAAWQTENLVAGLQDFYVLQDDLWDTVGQKMLDLIHEEVDSLSCEVSLAFVMNKAGSGPVEFFKRNNYQVTESKKLGYIWKDSAKEWQPDDSTLLYKKLREKRIMVPM